MVKFNNKLSKLVDINKGVRQGYPLSPTLFNIYLDEIRTKWQKRGPNWHQTFKKPATANTAICR
jgi:retron-type reverse transcriptase